MNSARLRQRIAFQAKVQSQDPTTGEITHTWQDVAGYADVPAEVLTGPGREPIVAAQKTAETTARINCRWFPGLDPAWRILWDGRVYDITSAETDASGRREWRLKCTDGLTDGS